MWRRQRSTLQTLLQVTWEGREQRVTDQVRIRIVLSLQHQLQTKRNIWNLDASTGVQNSRLQYSGGEEEIFRVQSKIGE